MKPLREASPGLEREAGQRLAAAGEVEPWSEAEQARLWNRIAASAEARRPTRAWIFAVPALAAAALLAFALVHRPQLATKPAPLVAQAIEAAPGARFALDAPLHATLREGQLTAHATRGPVVIETPRLHIEVLGSTTRVQVAAEVTTVLVDEGQARVSFGGGPVIALSGGERIRSDDSRLVAPAAPAPPVDACAATPDLQARKGCYTRLALGDDLAGQNALYALGLVDRGSAIAYWRAYQTRFPAGPLWPEATLGILTRQLAERRYPEALREADAYLAHDPDAPRQAEVRLIRANLLRERLDQPERALEAYRAVLKLPELSPATGDEAEFGAALASRALGRQAEAEAAMDQYLRDFPQGRHAAEIARLRAR